MKTHWLHFNQLIGHLAHWAVRLHPYHDPPGLGVVIKEYSARERPEFDATGMREVTVEQLQRMVDSLKFNPIVQKWNRPASEHKQPYVFVSRHGKPWPEDDFIDLDALCRCIVRSICREMAEADQAMEKAAPRFWQILERLKKRCSEERTVEE